MGQAKNMSKTAKDSMRRRKALKRQTRTRLAVQRRANRKNS